MSIVKCVLDLDLQLVLIHWQFVVADAGRDVPKLCSKMAIVVLLLLYILNRINIWLKILNLWP